MMPRLVPCDTSGGDLVYVNLNNVLKLTDLKDGGTEITFIDGAILNVPASPPMLLAGEGREP